MKYLGLGYSDVLLVSRATSMQFMDGDYGSVNKRRAESFGNSTQVILQFPIETLFISLATFVDAIHVDYEVKSWKNTPLLKSNAT